MLFPLSLKNPNRDHKVMKIMYVVEKGCQEMWVPIQKLFTAAFLFVLKSETQNNAFHVSFDLPDFTNLCILD